MNKVFIIERPRQGIEVSKAADYGDIHCIFEADERRASIFDTEQFCDDVLVALENKEFRCDADFICIVGSAIAVTLAVSAILNKYGRVKLLLFSANEDRYISRVLRRKNYAQRTAGSLPKDSISVQRPVRNDHTPA